MPVTTPMAKFSPKIRGQNRPTSSYVFSFAQGEGLEDDVRICQSHRELGEQVVERDREGELDAVPQQAVAHPGPRSHPGDAGPARTDP